MTKTTPRARTAADKLTQAGVETKRVYDIVLMDPADLTLERDPAHALFDPRVADKPDPDSAFYQDILANGVHTPIKARKNGERDGKPVVQVVDGRNRVQTLAHINQHHPLPAGPRRLKVILVTGGDGEMALLALSSNGGKPETPLSRAVKIGMAVKNGMALEDIARACGWTSVQHVQTHLAILNLLPEVQAAFHGPDALPLASVTAFARTPREEQAAALATVRAGGAKRVREVTAAVQAGREGTLYTAPTGPRKKIWSAERVGRLVAELERRREAEATREGAPEDPITLAFSEGAVAVLKCITGDTDAIQGYPGLQAAVVQISAAP